MKWRLTAVVVLLLTAVAAYLLLHSPNPPFGPAVPADKRTSVAVSESKTTPPSVARAAATSPSPTPGLSQPTPTTNRPADATPADSPTPDPVVDGLAPGAVVDNMRNAIRQYGSRFNGDPVGTNPEITKALNGGNPKQVRFLPPDSGVRINGKGELIDSWGTPFFFHQLSATEMEVRSAGPDKIMWTDDDLVAR